MKKSKYEILVRDSFTCQACGKVAPADQLQLAHRIMQARKSGQTSKYIQKYIKEKYNIKLNKKQAKDILHDELNLVTTCSLKCNDSFNIWLKPIERDALIDKIFKGI